MKKISMYCVSLGLSVGSLPIILNMGGLDFLLSFIGYNDKEYDRHSRYLGYIDEAIKKLQNAN